MGHLVLGTADGEPVTISAEQRETHMHVLGGSRMGKSYFLEHCIRQDIINGSGVCVIDPHGVLYDNLVDWLALSRAGQTRRVHLINPSEDGWSVGFNPLCPDDAEPSVRVDFMVEACAKVWEGANAEVKPRLTKCLSLVFYALAMHRLSIAEFRKFTTKSFLNDRRVLTGELQNWDRRKDWEEMNSYPERLFNEYMESTHTRLQAFASKPRVQRLMGQTDNLIDFRACMDNRDIVLVNLAGNGKLSERDAQTIGAMLFADIFVSAKQRDIETAKRRPFYCYVDECAGMITEDVANAMDQTAKFGLHYILAHHRMSQLLDYGEAFSEAIMTGAQSKVVFKVDRDDPAADLGTHLFRKSFDLTRRKEGLTNPVAVGQDVVTLRGRSRSSADGEIENWSSTDSSGSNNVSSTGTSTFTGVDGLMPGITNTAGVGSAFSNARADSSGGAKVHVDSEAVSEAETFKTVYEERGIPYSLEEQIHEATVRVRSLPIRNALVYRQGDDAPVQMVTKTIAKARILPKVRGWSVERFVDGSPYTSSDAEIARSIEARRVSVDDLPLVEDEPEDDEDQFRIKRS